MIRTIIIDDEHLARARIARLLRSYDQFELVGEASNGKEGIKLMKTNPDVVFLDIEMPDMSGFEMLEQLSDPPFIVFSTAYSQYALEAFNADAIDYLLKPYDEARFMKMLEKVGAYMGISITKKGAYLNEIEVQERGFSHVLSLKDVRYIEAFGNYVKLHTDRSHVWRSTLNNLAGQLDPGKFVRIHRSVIVNYDWVQRVSYKGKNVFNLELDNAVVHSGRKYATSMRSRFASPAFR